MSRFLFDPRMNAFASGEAVARAVGFKLEKVQQEKVGRMESTLMGRLKRKSRLRVLPKLLGIPHAAFAEDLIAVARK